MTLEREASTRLRRRGYGFALSIREITKPLINVGGRDLRNRFAIERDRKMVEPVFEIINIAGARSVGCFCFDNLIDQLFGRAAAVCRLQMPKKELNRFPNIRIKRRQLVDAFKILGALAKVEIAACSSVVLLFDQFLVQKCFGVRFPSEGLPIAALGVFGPLDLVKWFPLYRYFPEFGCGVPHTRCRNVRIGPKLPVSLCRSVEGGLMAQDAVGGVQDRLCICQVPVRKGS